MKIKIHQIPEEGLDIEGEEPPSVLNLSEKLFRFESPIRYQLNVMWVGKRGLLFRGRLSVMVRAQCVRSLEWFDLPIVVEDFQCHREEVRGDEVDLTPEVREDILLLLPSHPVLPKTELLKAELPAELGGDDRIWKKLDQLKIKK